MKILIFAGGAGKRFWPIEKESNPKQFIPLVKGKSTFERTLARIQPIYGWNNIYISTSEKYVTKIKEIAPDIAISNIIVEPTRRDVGPAVGLALIHLHKMNITEPIAILWVDHLIQDINAFQKTLMAAEKQFYQKKLM